ncbi:MAG TPA: lipocalin family protein [Bacteroidales bacterium]|nr:lipocalin family protein [Bacteroidales bacterium]HRS19186.1 lipocalin family protein [Bacteroidales bacterium]
MKLVSTIIIACVFFSCKGQKPKVDNSVVSLLDITKYVGTWYEIARYDHTFERGLVGVTATYTLLEDGFIQVVNKGFKDSLTGKEKVARGKAYIPNIETPSKLKVSFFLFFYSDYYVLELDKQYQWAVVGSKSDAYLWILYREPHMNSELYDCKLPQKPDSLKV